jgi:zinc protease
MRRNTGFTIISIALALSLVSFGQTLPKGVQKITSVEGITEYSIPNGLHVLLFPDASKPKVTVNITYMVGSRQEGYGETGMAHLLEHLLFKETKARKDIKKELTDHGADTNASTAWDRTNYYETLTATDENLKYAIDLEADRMINSKMEKPILDAEMTVVRNEFEMGENSPDRTLMQRALETSFAWHNYGKMSIGNRSDIEHVPIERLAAFYHRYYQPDNALIAIAGKFDDSKTLAWIVNAFGAIPKPARTLEPSYTVEPTQDGERQVTLRRVGDTQGIIALYHVPAGSHPDAPVLEVLAGVLGDTPSGRLYKALVDNKKSVSAGMDMTELHDPGFLMASVRLRADQSLDDARQTLLKTVEGFVNEPPSKEEVDRVKARLLKQFDEEMADSQAVAQDLSEYASQGDWRLLFIMRDHIKKVTPEDVLRVGKAYLKESNRTLAVFIPTKTPDRAEIPDAPPIASIFKDFKGTEGISQGEVFDPTPANIESRVMRDKLPGGMKVVLLPKKTRGGVVVANITVRYGDEKSLMGKAAVSQIAGGLLMRGTRNKSRQQIQDAMDKLKASISVNGGPTSATASIQTVEANFAGALRLAAEILKEPAFPESEFETVRQQRIASVEAGRSDPQMLAIAEFRRHTSPYPRGDIRHVSTPEEQIENLKKVTLDDVRKFYTQFYGASVGEFAAVGQFDAAEARKIGAELFGDWKSPGTYQRVPTTYRKVDPENNKIETPDKQNAMFVAGELTKMSDEDPDYPAMILADYMLGGSSLGSRLFHRIRDKEGLSYGVQSQFGAPAKDDGASFIMVALSNPGNTPKVEASMKDELVRTIKDGFTAEEVAAAQKSWLQERQVGRSEDGALAGLLADHTRFDRTMEFDKAMEVKVAALTADGISAAFRRHVDPAALTIVKAGDFKKAGVLQ